MLHERTAIALVLSCLCVQPVRGQQSACLERTIPVSVESLDGAADPALSSIDLEGSYRNKPVQIKLVELERRLPRIILLLDISSSMQIARNQGIDMAEYVLSRIPDVVEVGLAYFADNLEPVTPPQQIAKN